MSDEKKRKTHEHQVHHAFLIDASAKVLVIPSRKPGPDTMMCIHHARHAVEPEAVKLVLVHVVPQIGEQEAHDLVVAVVEEPRVPELVLALGALVEILVVGPVEFIKTVEHVFARVRVHDIKQNG
jgi:hypothetical protein